jgi:hypothetical protein
MDDRIRRLEAEHHGEERRFNALVQTGTFLERKRSLERLKEIEAELAEARGMSLTGEGTPRS